MKSLVLILLAVYSHMVFSSQRVHMTSLDWPPYSGEELAENGVSIAIAREAFAVMGYELVVEFKPWVRTVTLASKQDKYIGYFPEYKFDTDEFVFSDSIGQSLLGFVEPLDSRVEWATLDDLSMQRIGIVQGYVNTEEFDGYALEGRLQVEAAINDLKNVYKVAKGRLDLAVIDQNVLHYLISNDPRREVLQARLAFNERLLENKDIVLAFRNTQQGRHWKEVFNQGLKQVDIDIIIERLSHSEHLHQAVNLK